MYVIRNDATGRVWEADLYEAWVYVDLPAYSVFSQHGTIPLTSATI